MDEREKLKGSSTNVGSNGSVMLVDWLGSDSSVCEAARTSYGEGTRKISEDEGLIRYLMRHNHSSPFEAGEVAFSIDLPIYVMRQIVRHRSAHLNEMSLRYSLPDAEDTFDITPNDGWRYQSKDNKQGSDDYIIGDAARVLSLNERAALSACKGTYEEAIDNGVAREQARKILPLSTMTRIFWKCDLRNTLHFLALRMDKHAQLETRAFADAMYFFVKALFPIVTKAFDDYHPLRGGMSLSAIDIRVIKHLQGYRYDSSVKTLDGYLCEAGAWPRPPAKCRERDECIEKLERLGLWN